jgi:2',3'-cyclic-nucleotide 2'-phosphodiesterase (5'-nucleotidase family)
MPRLYTVLGFVLFVTLWLALPLAAAQDATFALTLMHTNDTRTHHDPNRAGNGGVAIQAAVVNQIRAEVEHSLLLDAGDRFAGTLYHTVFLGQDQIEIMSRDRACPVHSAFRRKGSVFHPSIHI